LSTRFSLPLGKGWGWVVPSDFYIISHCIRLENSHHSARLKRLLCDDFFKHLLRIGIKLCGLLAHDFIIQNLREAAR
jgi:hypothetical protein